MVINEHILKCSNRSKLSSRLFSIQAKQSQRSAPGFSFLDQNDGALIVAAQRRFEDYRFSSKGGAPVKS